MSKKPEHKYTFTVHRVYVSGSDIYTDDTFTATVKAVDEDEAERRVKKLVKPNTISYSHKFKIRLSHIEEA